MPMTCSASPWGLTFIVCITNVTRNNWVHDTPAAILEDHAEVPCLMREASMVTVEADLEHVESRLKAGEIPCPSCPGGILGGWGHARPRTIIGTAMPIRPRRARCRTCRATHVLLPVTLLLRRAYLADWIWAALVAKARGHGHRDIAHRLRIPASTVRGWLRRVSGHLRPVREWFIGVAVAVGVDPAIPTAADTAFGDTLAAISAATTATISRFGPGGILGAVTDAAMAVAASGGRLLAPGWPPQPAPVSATRVAPAAEAAML